MFLVAQAAGLQSEFKEAVGSWDAVRDARAAWHTAQAQMPSSVAKVGSRDPHWKLAQQLAVQVLGGEWLCRQQYVDAS